jgi:hypothetical protein
MCVGSAVDDHQRQALVTAFNNALRACNLVGTVDLQRTSLAFAAMLQNLPRPGVVPLGPIYDLLLSQKAPESAAREVLLVLKSREARFTARLELPPPLQALSDEERARIVMAHATRTSSPSVPVQQPSAMQEAANVAAEQTAKESSTSGFVPPKRKAQQAGGQRRLLLALVALVVLFVGERAVSAFLEPPPLKTVELKDPAGLPCVNAVQWNDKLVCPLPRAFVDSTSKEAMKARGAITKATAVAKGLKEVQVSCVEDGSLLWQF